MHLALPTQIVSTDHHFQDFIDTFWVHFHLSGPFTLMTVQIWWPYTFGFGYRKILHTFHFESFGTVQFQTWPSTFITFDYSLEKPRTAHFDPGPSTLDSGRDMDSDSDISKPQPHHWSRKFLFFLAKIFSLGILFFHLSEKFDMWPRKVAIRGFNSFDVYILWLFWT